MLIEELINTNKKNLLIVDEKVFFISVVYSNGFQTSGNLKIPQS
jgi:hypothetical protein